MAGRASARRDSVAKKVIGRGLFVCLFVVYSCLFPHFVCTVRGFLLRFEFATGSRKNAGLKGVSMKRNREAGQALIFAVLALGLLLMGFVGLGIDVGYLRYEKRLQQAAADSAAIAGASDLGYGGHSAALAAAAAASATSGFSDNTGAKNTPCGTSAPIGCVTVTVNNGPASGPHSGVATSADYVEVYVAATYSTFFMRVLGIPNATVTARAVATNLSSGINNGCLFTLGNPSSK